ncbi:putative uncharacterized transposon-derived protein F52C9.6 [Nymphon striatum]|nr:putative uncharacterized transposon-derived protein F52C9.6 [Nymphon striatum]
MLDQIFGLGTSNIKLHTNTNKIKLEKGARQGDSISPKLFTACLENVFRGLNWTFKGIPINGDRLTNLRFAEDVVLFSESPQELQLMVEELRTASSKVGLEINLSKTKVMFNRNVEIQPIMTGNVALDQVDRYIYLGQLISIHRDWEPEVRRRVALGWQAFGRLNNVWSSKLPLCLKRKPPGAVATTKHEEWTTKKKVQQVVTKEVETRVQRQLVTEDGVIVEDSGPQITQKTREEKKTNEEEDNQHKTPTGEPPTDGYAVTPGAAVITTRTESRQNSHEVKEDHKETHDEHVEDISGEEFHRRAVMGHEVSDGALMRRSGTPSSYYSSTGPRIVNQTVTHQTEEEADDEVPEDAADEVDHYGIIIRSKRKDEEQHREHREHRRREHHHREQEQEQHREHREHRQREHHHRQKDSGSRSSDRRKREKYKDARESSHRSHEHSRKSGDYEEVDESKRLETDKWIEHHFTSGSSTDGEVTSLTNKPSSIIRINMSSQTNPNIYHVTKINTENNSVKSLESPYEDRNLTNSEHNLNANSSSRRISENNNISNYSSHYDVAKIPYQISSSSSRNTESSRRERKHAHKTRSISPSYRDMSPSEYRTGTMRSDASSQTNTPKDQYYME